MKKNTNPETLTLRLATMSDAKLIFEWANDPIVRERAFCQAQIPWESHLEWLKQKLASPKTRIYIAEDKDGRPFGQIRFDNRNNIVEISISIASFARGRGFASQLILNGQRLFSQDFPLSKFVAFVKIENIASAHAFSSAGFRIVKTCKVNDCMCNCFQFHDVAQDI